MLTFHSYQLRFTSPGRGRRGLLLVIFNTIRHDVDGSNVHLSGKPGLLADGIRSPAPGRT
jgi:hypothetical protein